MEKETRTTRFCLVCNYVSRIIDPITSRCTKFRFTPLNKEKIIERLQFICNAEQLTIEDKALNSIVEISEGDLRRAITTLQVCITLVMFTNFKLSKLFKLSSIYFLIIITTLQVCIKKFSFY